VTSVVRFEEWQEPTGTTAATTDASGNVTFSNDVTVSGGATVSGDLTVTGNMTSANQGLVFIKSQTIGSGVSSVTVNDAFSSTYENYRVIITKAAYSGSNTTVMFRPSNATTGYYGLMDVDLYTGATSTDYYNNGSFIGIGITTTVAGASVSSTDIFQASLPLRTLIVGQHYGNGYMGRHIGNHNVNQSHTSFTIAPNSGTITGGTIWVYGYNNG